jgi:hypothetical protein
VANANDSSAARPAAPLAPVLALTWLASLGTGAVTNGLFFVTHEQLGFGEVRNLLLAVVMGASYTLGAWRAAPAIRAAIHRNPKLSTRACLGWVNAALAVASFLPWLAGGAEWAFWVMATTYLPLTGVLWPVVEAYLSGGRRGAALRKATGAFNFSWSTAVLAAFWLMAPALEAAPLLVVAGMGVVHVICAGIVVRLPEEPAGHGGDGSQPHPPVYERLLPVFRVLLTLSYVLVSAIEPILPARLSALGVRAGLSTPLASTWTAARVGIFVLCTRWHGWHGRWRTVVWTAGAMLLGFGLVAMGTSVPVVGAGLALFGVGAGGVYVAAIYYAMAVGKAEVDAGGAHEAVIGLGYTAGPLPALAAHGLVAAGVLRFEHLSSAMTLLVGVVAAGAIALAWILAKRAAPGR